MNKQSGFAALEIIIFAIVVGVIGFTAYNFISRSDQNPTSATATVTQAPEVKTANDLNAASHALDAINVDESALDSVELDAEVAAF